MAGLALAATVALASILTARSLDWPLVNDAPLMHYIALRILDGAVPYRDLFDMNFPGVYLVHMVALMLFGFTDAAFRMLDLTLLVGVVAGLSLVLYSYGAWAMGWGAALFWLYHIADGPGQAGQRDLMLCVLLAWMTAALFAYLRSGHQAMLALASLSLGAAIWIRPHVALLGALPAVLAWCRPPGERMQATAAMTVGLVTPAVAVVSWLAVTGGLAAFVDIVGGYLLPLYSRLGRDVAQAEAGRLAARGHPAALVLAGLGLSAGGASAVLCRAGRVDTRLAVLVAGLLYGGLHVALQGKLWPSHFYPFAVFAVALSAAGLGVALETGRRLPSAALVAVLLLTVVGLGVKGFRNLHPPWAATQRAQARAVAEALRPVVAAGGRIQVLDINTGGVLALYLLRARQPTRFIYDFHFYHDVEHPYIQRLRSELLEGLRARPPAAVVLFERGWPSGDYRRVARFPALAAWLDDGYRVSEQAESFRIYAARVDR